MFRLRFRAFFLSVFAALVASSLQGMGGNKPTPLMKAAITASLGTMRMLLANGANPSAVAFRDFPHAGKPVLRYAIDSQSPEAVQLLLDHNADVNDITESPIITNNDMLNVRNLSLLAHAINTYAPMGVIQTLINHSKTNLDQKSSGWTPLMVAAYRGYKAAANALITAGADPLVINYQDSRTAIDYAAEKGFSDIVKLLQQASQA